MAQNEIDAEDALVFALFGLSAAASVGIADVQLFGYAFSDTITTVMGSAISLAAIVSAAAFLWVAGTNQVGIEDVRDLDEMYYYAVIGTAILVFVVPFVPQVHDFVTTNDLYALAAVTVQAVGVVAISYMA